MRCSRTAKAIGSSFPRTERVETKPCGRGFPDADLSREMQESRHYCRDSRVNQSKAALFLARACVIDLHRLLFLAALIFVPFKAIWFVSTIFITSRVCLFHPGI